MNENAEIIKDRVTMRDICDAYGIAVVNNKVCCPFHGEKTPSLVIYPGRRGWYCFGCHESGDAISFVQRLFGLSFDGALRKLNDDFRLGLNIQSRSRQDRSDAYIAARKRQTERKRMESSLQALETAYNALDTEWVELHCSLQSYALDAVLDSTDESVAERICAVRERLDVVENELDGLESEIYKVRQKLKVI